MLTLSQERKSQPTKAAAVHQRTIENVITINGRVAALPGEGLGRLPGGDAVGIGL